MVVGLSELVLPDFSGAIVDHAHIAIKSHARGINSQSAIVSTISNEHSSSRGVFDCDVMVSPFVVDGRKETLSVTESRRGSGEKVRYNFRRTSVRHTHPYFVSGENAVLKVVNTHCDLGDQCIARIMGLFVASCVQPRVF